MLGVWLVGAVVIHDGILSPLVVSHRLGPVPRRAAAGPSLPPGCVDRRRAVTVIALPMIYRRKSRPANKAILQQNFAGNLTVMLGIIAVLSLVAYAVRVARDRVPAAASWSEESDPA